MDEFILFQDFVVNGSLPDPPNLMQISLFVTYVKFVVVAFFFFFLSTVLKPNCMKKLKIGKVCNHCSGS